MDKHLWPQDTGITDLPDDWRRLEDSQTRSIAGIWSEQRDRLKGASQLAQFTKRLNREWAIETGIIENLYEIERGVTQTLIEHGFHSDLLERGSTNKPRDFVISLLKDQESALEGLFDFVASRRTLSVSYIKELHAALCRSQTHVDAVDSLGRSVPVELIRGAWKIQPNYPERDGERYLYCPPEQVDSEMERLVELHRQHDADSVPVEVQAAWLHHRFTIIHPFQDGNGRVARALASLVFIRGSLFPLIVARDDKADYLRALESADSGDLAPLVKLFAKLQRVQFRKATAVSESVLGESATVNAALSSLAEAIDRKEAKQREAYSQAYSRAYSLKDKAKARLEELAGELEGSLRRLDPSGRALVSASTDDTDYYFRGQIIETAKRLGYFADTGPYRSWVRLKLEWTRKAQIVIAFHSIGAQFAGVLVAAPFLEFRDDSDAETGAHTSLIRIAAEPFEIYYDEEQTRVEARFMEWLDGALTAAIAEITNSL